MITAILFSVVLWSGCASPKAALQEAAEEPWLQTDFKQLETALIEEYLRQPEFAFTQDSNEVFIYNQTDQLEFAGAPESPDARLLMLKCDLLLDIDHTAIYRINR